VTGLGREIANLTGPKWLRSFLTYAAAYLTKLHFEGGNWLLCRVANGIPLLVSSVHYPTAQVLEQVSPGVAHPLPSTIDAAHTDLGSLSLSS
jgi:hypothetical protein